MNWHPWGLYCYKAMAKEVAQRLRAEGLVLDARRCLGWAIWIGYPSLLDRPLDPHKARFQGNQCDGCARGLPLRDGIHVGEGYDMIGCTREEYQ